MHRVRLGRVHRVQREEDDQDRQRDHARVLDGEVLAAAQERPRLASLGALLSRSSSNNNILPAAARGRRTRSCGRGTLHAGEGGVQTGGARVAGADLPAESARLPAAARVGALVVGRVQLVGRGVQQRERFPS